MGDLEEKLENLENKMSAEDSNAVVYGSLTGINIFMSSYEMTMGAIKYFVPDLIPHDILGGTNPGKMILVGIFAGWFGYCYLRLAKESLKKKWELMKEYFEIQNKK
jgi:L-cystine uptake protein TcyP (sodium:dicarboxylate symporter family)